MTEGNEKSNPEVLPPVYEEKSNIEQSDYSQTESLVEKHVAKMHQSKAMKQQMIPESAIDTAHLLLENSETSEYMLEIDKEIKLANLDANEKYAVYQFTGVWNDLLWLKEKQTKKVIEAKVRFGDLYDNLGDDELMNALQSAVEKTNPEFFDDVGAYKKARFIATLSRGKLGFERIQQIRTISEYKMEQRDMSEQSPGFMQKYFGGFKK